MFGFDKTNKPTLVTDQRRLFSCSTAALTRTYANDRSAKIFQSVSGKALADSGQISASYQEDPFLGESVDRGLANREAAGIARAIADAGDAPASMVNLEYGAIALQTPRTGKQDE
ncbi:hypothetical protein SAMN06265222_105291 [Neorhodopirellula lusitana]|uniref:Uncharacterized protein n=1 Tax=Neorhodopirellula lusitana TaxID=445327 RepID=A0ABY1Q361_9BACT|nr:hypothetical protein SAMN06265222_105291 [Neorhodopirellula lusitana]